MLHSPISTLLHTFSVCISLGVNDMRSQTMVGWRDDQPSPSSLSPTQSTVSTDEVTQTKYDSSTLLYSGVLYCMSSMRKWWDRALHCVFIPANATYCRRNARVNQTHTRIRYAREETKNSCPIPEQLVHEWRDRMSKWNEALNVVELLLLSAWIVVDVMAAATITVWPLVLILLLLPPPSSTIRRQSTQLKLNELCKFGISRNRNCLITLAMMIWYFTVKALYEFNCCLQTILPIFASNHLPKEKVVLRSVSLGVCVCVSNNKLNHLQNWLETFDGSETNCRTVCWMHAIMFEVFVVTSNRFWNEKESSRIRLLRISL